MAGDTELRGYAGKTKERERKREKEWEGKEKKTKKRKKKGSCIGETQARMKRVERACFSLSGREKEGEGGNLFFSRIDSMQEWSTSQRAAASSARSREEGEK